MTKVLARNFYHFLLSNLQKSPKRLRYYKLGNLTSPVINTNGFCMVFNFFSSENYSLAQILLPEIFVLLLLNDSDNITKQHMMSTTFTVLYKQRNRQMELNDLTKEMLLIDGKIRM